MSGGVLNSDHFAVGVHGTFTQTGGMNSASVLTIGDGSHTGGIYNLQGGSFVAAPVHVTAGGTFNQSGGTFTGVIDVDGGTFTLSGTGGFSPTFANQINLSTGVLNQFGGSLGNAAVTQTGGSIFGTLVNTGSFTYFGGTFGGKLQNQGAVTFNADFLASFGIENDATMTIGSRRSVGVAQFDWDNEGLVFLAGGTLQGGQIGAVVNNGVISGFGNISSPGPIMNNVSIVQSGGNLSISSTTDSLRNTGTISLASGFVTQLVGSTTLSNTGTVNLNGGAVLGGTFSNAAGGNLTGPGTITSAFGTNAGLVVVNNGTLNISQPFTNNGAIQLTAFTANLSGGAITNTGIIQGQGNVANAVASNGTIEPIAAARLCSSRSGTFSNQANGSDSGSAPAIVTPGHRGIGCEPRQDQFQTGGTFDNNGHAMMNSGQISGYGVFATGGLTNNGSITFTGGTTTINGDVTNSSGKTITVAYNPAIFTGNVTNNGTFNTNGTTVTFAGTFTSNGVFSSDPAIQHFQDLVIGATGALVGGAGDQFTIAGSLLNHSNERLEWDTRDAEIDLIGGVNHLLLRSVALRSRRGRRGIRSELRRRHVVARRRRFIDAGRRRRPRRRGGLRTGT